MDFKNEEEALKMADEMIAMNRADFGHAGLKVEHPTTALLNRYLYVEGTGTTRTWTSGEKKKLHAAADVKGGKALANAKEAMEICGAADGATKDEVVVTVAWEKTNTAAMDLRTAHTPYT